MSRAIVLHIGPFEVRAETKDSEPAVLDLVIGARVGLGRPRRIRETIRRAIDEGSFREGEHYRKEARVRPPGTQGWSAGADDSTKATSESFEKSPPPSKAAGEIPAQFQRTSPRKDKSFEKSPPPSKAAGEIPDESEWPVEDEFWLTEAGALKLITRLRTPAADAVVDEMIRVYREAIRQLRDPRQREPVPVLAEVANGPRVGESEFLRREVAFYCYSAARFCEVRIQRIHGVVRREFRVAGVYHLSTLLWPHARAMLDAIAKGRLALPRRLPPAPPPVSPRQQKLWS